MGRAQWNYNPSSQPRGQSVLSRDHAANAGEKLAFLRGGTESLGMPSANRPKTYLSPARLAIEEVRFVPGTVLAGCPGERPRPHCKIIGFDFKL